MTKVVAVDADIDFSSIDGLVFTSANAVRQFAARWSDRHLKAWCVGDATRDEALAVGLAAVSAGGSGQDLLNLLGTVEGRLLHVRGVHSTGLPLEHVVIYDQIECPIAPESATALRSGVDFATFFSPRTARLFAEMAKKLNLDFQGTVAVCLSGEIGNQLALVGFGQVIASKHPNVQSLIVELRRLV